MEEREEGQLMMCGKGWGPDLGLYYSLCLQCASEPYHCLATLYGSFKDQLRCHCFWDIWKTKVVSTHSQHVYSWIIGFIIYYR